MNLFRFDRFSEQARMALALALEEMHRHGARAIGTEHLLLGILRVPDSPALRVLNDLGVDVDEVRAAVEAEGSAPHVGGARAAGRAGMTFPGRRAIGIAMDEARRQRSQTLDTGYLLLGLVREGDGIAATVLQRFGVTAEQVRARLPLGDATASETASAPPSGPKNNVVTCRLDDRAVEALDALVEAGIRPTRSDAAAWLISTGIEAHRALFERVNATVDEIRRLRLQAQTIAHIAEHASGCPPIPTLDTTVRASTGRPQDDDTPPDDAHPPGMRGHEEHLQSKERTDTAGKDRLTHR